ncbi:glutathione-disulfide reductase [Rhizobacter sp. Root1221]|uniref:glutathione-disulfide reductase n=1 Tax=Rhizobacter sp. Root1221 TaxID=1736433 RepID=UPI0006FF1C03|nr:glutathione-disulfide reductase [Rhizobacter sp. Root1221]KQV98056.1 glutathione reductase [Rhizobacter sp. Root1221]
MDTYDCDFFVVGAGSGGVRASRMAAARGASVIVAEGGALGGTCVNLGCIPKKLYSHAAHYAELFEESVGFGWAPHEPSFDWPKLKARRAAEIARLNGVYDNLLANAGVRLVRGWARLADAHTVVVRHESGAENRFTARHILLATGGRPQAPSGAGADSAVTSDDMFDLDPFPRRLVVVGGGYIACEFASIFAGLGSEVTLVHRGPRLLRGFDDEVAAFAAAEMQKKGLTLRLNAMVTSVRRLGGAQVVQLSDGATVEADTVLQATGRAAFTEGLGLEALGITLHADGTVPVDEHFNTVVPSVHAIGDLVGHKALTPVALAEAMVLVDRLFGDGTRPPLDYDTIATAVFTHPNIGTVGKSEERARKDHGDVRIFRAEFKALKHTLSDSTERTLMKIVVDAATDRVLGMHMVGADAGEVIQGFAVAVQAGLTKAQIDRTIGIHPTVAEEFVTMREPVR